MIDAGRTTVGWICAAFGLPEVPDAAIIPVSRGAMGQIWRLDLGADRFAVKELFWGADEEPARNEAELTAHLEAAGIRLPASVPGPGGCFVARLPADSGGGWLRLYRWIDGMPVDLADAGVAARAGSLLGRATPSRQINAVGRKPTAGLRHGLQDRPMQIPRIPLIGAPRWPPH